MASFSATTGLTLYVDGAAVGTSGAATSAQNFVGYWTIGYSYGLNWSPKPSSYYLDGGLAEVAVFPSALSAGQVTTLYNGDSGTEANFETRALADNPSEYWPLQAAAATTQLPDVNDLPDISGNNNLGLPQGGVTPSDLGPFGSDGAMYFDGATDGSSWIETTTDNSALPSSFTLAAWLKPRADRVAVAAYSRWTARRPAVARTTIRCCGWMTAARSSPGPGLATNQALSSPAAYNDGKWHFVVATVSAAGLKLYLDGSLVASDSSGTSGGSQGGYWLIGQGDEGNWSDPPANAYWTGQLAHVAYFATALSSGEISTLYAESTVGAYETQLLAYSPTYYWPLTDSGTTEAAEYPFFQTEPDSSGSDDTATAVGGVVTLGVPGPFSSGYAASFNGATGYLETAGSVSSPNTFSLVAWFKAPLHGTGGCIIGLDNLQTGGGYASQHDRTIWMDDSGRIVAGISGGSGVEATSTSTYDNGAWHLAVATFTPTKLTLYIDGAQAASVTSGISDVSYTGYWSVGYAVDTTWADIPATSEWDGSLADVAVIPSALPSGTVGAIDAESSQTALAAELSSLSPTAFWPLASAASSTDDAGGVEISAQAANNGTTTCLFPAGAGTCPSLAETDFLSGTFSSEVSTPTSTHPTTLTLTSEEPTAAPSPFAGLDLVIPIDLTGS